MAAMENRLIEYFSQISPLTEDEKEGLIKSMELRTFNKGEIIVEEGRKHTDTFFVLEGLVRQYKMMDGDDITTGFFTEEQWIISSADSTGDLFSKFNLICMENCVLVIGNEEKATNLFKQFPRFETISRQIMETAFMEQQNMMATYITDKPEQRYLKLIESRPDILQRVPQYDIATYIGVKPESLSRIRKKLLNKN